MKRDMSSRGSTAPEPTPKRKAAPFKRWLKRILLAAVAFLLLVLVFAAWLFNTEAGARFAFRFLPSELTVAGISGTFASSLKVNKLAFKVAGTEITLVNGKITSRWRQLLSNQIAIDELELDGLRVIHLFVEPESRAGRALIRRFDATLVAAAGSLTLGSTTKDMTQFGLTVGEPARLLLAAGRVPGRQCPEPQ